MKSRQNGNHTYRRLLVRVFVLLLCWALLGLASGAMAYDDPTIEIGGGDLDDLFPVRPTLNIPNGVRAIEEEAFYGDTSVTDVFLPDSVETIGPRAFAYSGLTYIRLSSGLTSIAADAFEGVTAMDVNVIPGTWAASWWEENKARFGHGEQAMPTEYFEYSELDDGTVRIDRYVGPEDAVNVIIPQFIIGKTVTVIGDCSFNNQSGLSGRLVLPAGVISIGTSAFSGCGGISEIRLQEGLEEIHHAAFYDCDSLTVVHLPASITRLDSEAFGSCDHLIQANYPLSWTELNTAYSDYSPFAWCESLTSVEIPNGVTNIVDYAFRDCTGLTSIAIPDSVLSIGSDAFADCNSLSEIYCMNPSYAWDWCVENGYEDLLVEWDGHSIIMDHNPEYHGHHYRCIIRRTTWQEARRACESLGGHLATISSADENEFILSILPDGNLDYWIGCTDDINEGDWRWVTGEPFTYANWSSDNPNNDFDGQQDYGVFLTGPSGVGSAGEWDDDLNDANNSYLGGYICEWDTTNYIVSETVRWNNHTYQRIDDGCTWQEAKNLCEKAGGHLVTIVSSEEQTIVETLVENGTKNNYWMGGYREEDAFSWITGETFGYTNWAPGQPDHNYEDALEMYRITNPNSYPGSGLGNWNDLSTDGTFEEQSFFGVSNFGYICEWDDYIPWTGYVLVSRAPTYDSPTGTNDGGHYVNNVDPVTVLGEEGGRYYIEYILTAGGTLKRWVDKCYISKKNYYEPWTGFVLNERVDTYATENSTSVNGYVDNLDPVTVLGESTDRYYISMVLTGGGTAFRWVEKQYIGSTDPAVRNVRLAGLVLTEDQLPIPNVTVAVSVAGGELLYLQTGADGDWSVDGLELNRQVTIICEKDSFVFEPVSVTTDSAQMQMDITGTAAGTGYLFVSADLLRASPAGEQFSFTVTGSNAWTAVCEGSGVNANVSQGPAGSTEITMVFAPNTGMARSGKYIITDGENTAVVYLLQAGERSGRIPDPVITYPAADHDTVSFEALTVAWDEVEYADSYVVSLRDLDTGVLLFSHETAEGLSMTVPTEYFADDHNYRVAVGAVPGGVASTDSSVSWCERLFTVLPEEAEEPYITGYVYVMSDIQARAYNGAADENMTDDELNTLIGVYGQPVSNVRVHVSHYDEIDNENVADGFITTDENGHYDSRTIDGTGASLQMNEKTFYTFSFVDPENQITFRTVYITTLEKGENELKTVFGVREIETWQGSDDPYASVANKGRPHGLYAEYFAYDRKPGTNADAWDATLKRNEGAVSQIDFNWGNETISEGFWTNTKTYNMLRAWPYNDSSHSGKELLTVNFVPQKFSVRFNGFIQLNGEDGADYKFRVRGDDGVAITLQTNQTSKYVSASGWKNGGANTSVVTLPAGIPRGYVVQVEILYYNKGGDAKLILEYSHDVGLNDSQSTWTTVPGDWLYQGSRTIWISERTGIMNVYKARLDAVDKKISTWTDKKVEGYLKDIISQIGGSILPEFSLAENLFGTVQDSYVKAFGVKFASNVESTIKKKLTNSIYGAVAARFAGTEDEKTNWQVIAEKVAEAYQVDVSAITPKSLASDSFNVFITYGEIAEYIYSHRTENQTPAQAKLYEVFYNLSFSDSDHIREADRLNPNATMASVIIQKQESEDTMIDEAKLLKEIKDDKDTNNIISLANKGLDLLKEIKNDGNRTRAVMSLLYAEQGSEVAKKLFNSPHGESTAYTLFWHDYFNGELGSRKSFEEKMKYATDSVTESLISELSGVNLMEIMLKEVYMMTLDAVESYYSGLIKGL